MAAPILSSSWYRVAARKPKLRSHVRLRRHRYRGEVWYLLQDTASFRVHRFTPASRLIIGLMDGSRSVAQLWEIANRRLGEHAPTQDEMIQLMGQLHAADMLQTDVTPDLAELISRGEREDKAKYRQSFANPMAIRIPLWDPDAFLNRYQKLFQPIWSRWGAFVWLAVVLFALSFVPPHWPELSNDFSDHVLATDNLFILYLTFPVIKFLHELGHATATKAGGGEVHDLGLLLLVLMPVPYVEASAATIFKSKYQRAVVGFAGVAVELFIAALAFFLWLLIEPGLVRAVLFNVMLIASVSTLIFNGNPLLRYDAYYILADLIEIPNLAARSARYWGYLIERYALGVVEADPPDVSNAEKGWFVFYGLASTVYRILVTVVIALFIAGRFFFIGVLLALWAVAAMAILPLIRAIGHFTGNPRLRKHRGRAFAVIGAASLLLGSFVFLVPMPYHSFAEGVLWLPEQAIVRAGANSFVESFLVQPGAQVVNGEALLQFYNLALVTQLRRNEAQVAELEAQYTAEFVEDRAKAQIIRDKLESQLASLALAREQVSELVAHANTDGTFIAPQINDLPGRFFHKGEPLGYVIGKARPLVRVVISQDAIDKVRLETDRVRVRLVDRPQIVLEGRVIRQVPAGEEDLPSKAFATEGGGEIATDPRDPKKPKALQRQFQIDVELEGVGSSEYFGQRVFVRFEHPRESLATRWYRSIRLQFLSSFNV
jgi:putative peptide zinc metalloprotease protein